MAKYLFLIHGWCSVYSYTEDDVEYHQGHKRGEKMMLETAALFISICYAPWLSSLTRLPKPPQMTCLSSSLSSTTRIITQDSAGSVCQHSAPFLEFVWASGFVGSCWWWHRAGAKVKDLHKVLDYEVPDLFKIGKPDLPVVLMSTELSDLVVDRAGAFGNWQMFSKVRWKSGEEEKPISPLTLSSTL